MHVANDSDVYQYNRGYGYVMEEDDCEPNYTMGMHVFPNLEAVSVVKGVGAGHGNLPIVNDYPIVYLNSLACATFGNLGVVNGRFPCEVNRPPRVASDNMESMSL